MAALALPVFISCSILNTNETESSPGRLVASNGHLLIHFEQKMIQNVTIAALALPVVIS